MRPTTPYLLGSLLASLLLAAACHAEVRLDAGVYIKHIVHGEFNEGLLANRPIAVGYSWDTVNAMYILHMQNSYYNESWGLFYDYKGLQVASNLHVHFGGGLASGYRGTDVGITMGDLSPLVYVDLTKEIGQTTLSVRWYGPLIGLHCGYNF